MNDFVSKQFEAVKKGGILSEDALVSLDIIADELKDMNRKVKSESDDSCYVCIRFPVCVLRRKLHWELPRFTFLYSDNGYRAVFNEIPRHCQYYLKGSETYLQGGVDTHGE